MNSEQADIAVEEYGMMAMDLGFVIKLSQDASNAELLQDEVDAWWDHQDVFVVRRLPASPSDLFAGQAWSRPSQTA
ncbi:hypothetical protein [Mesorhizobium sp. L103C105A0]|uniref:hypothetical protein n=1 Tax=Mesorhizobium sp. L103C105A0 TaxID=1287074 RepID=UPI0003D002C8|nr:hypothetical protein [Mesorhizobium sp. L103C105A0]ESZ74424.1 hypothetical protein X726_22990 [Mesorhizobium sp. L103C105A0]